MKKEHITGAEWIHREILGIGMGKEDETRTIVGGAPILEAWPGLELVPLLGQRCMTEIECILKSRIGLPLGSWVPAESRVAEERSLKSILELEEVSG